MLSAIGVLRATTSLHVSFVRARRVHVPEGTLNLFFPSSASLSHENVRILKGKKR